MTDASKKRITDMRIAGMGYKAIATALDMTRDAVKSFCKRNNLAGDGACVSLNAGVTPGTSCEECGAALTQPSKGRVRRFCSDKCRRDWWQKHPEYRTRSAVYELRCVRCGKFFKSYGNKNRKFCCHNCYVSYRFYREEHSDAL